MVLGLDENLKMLPMLQRGIAMVRREIEIPVERYGNYMELMATIKSDEDTLGMAKELLVKKLAEGLMESEVVRIIVKDHSQDGPLSQFVTFGAQLAVVDWEQLTGRAIRFRFMDSI